MAASSNRSSSRVATALFCASALVAGCSKRDEPAAPTPITVVTLDPSAPAPQALAVQACAGLRNRKAGGSVFVEADPHDATWLDELGLVPAATLGASAFVEACVAEFPRCVRYDYEAQQALLPNVLTVAAALGAVPLDASLPFTCGEVAFDATRELADYATPALATKWVFDRFGQEATGLAMLNPGYEPAPRDPAHPAMTGEMRPALVDYVFSQKLFVVFLVNGCIAGNADNVALDAVVNSGRFETPLGVYGYNDSWNVAGGDLYEAQTRCLASRNMGAIATTTRNLSFFSTRRAPIVAPHEVEPNATPAVAWSPEKTYVAFVVGDGDNVDYMMSTRHDWFRQRVAECERAGGACPALTWTISPHLPSLAPDLLAWYYEQSHRTGNDHFMLPPSGHLYAYPSSLAEAAQDRFVAATEADARVLGVTGTVHWDWNGTWHDAEDHFLPKYAKADGAIRGVFPVNVPYLVSTFDWWPAERFFEILDGTDGGRVALFRPREWRGVNDDANPFFVGPQKMADELAGHPKGTVTWVYMTSDGGLSLENSFLAVAKLLPAHVELVSADAAAKLALEATPK